MLKLIGKLILLHAVCWMVGFNLLSVSPNVGLLVMALPTMICIGMAIWGLAKL